MYPTQIEVTYCFHFQIHREKYWSIDSEYHDSSIKEINYKKTGGPKKSVILLICN